MGSSETIREKYIYNNKLYYILPNTLAYCRCCDIPFMNMQKSLDAAAFRQIHVLILAKQHLTMEGLEQIRLIKNTMNRARIK